ncbi:MAG: aldehyde dehydrogenase [Chlamydiae bacterium]|nr:aldehyde dehydrogenase [Chlamydiota bacterium]MBM3202054.1 aldehyde dehydrogenase [Chlamydiota bacterium]
MTVKIGINGFGRIGKIVFRQLFERLKDRDVLFFINDIATPNQIRYSLLFDTNYGHFKYPVVSLGDSIQIGSHKIPIYKETSPENVPWDVDIVIESTGRFTALEKAKAHRAKQNVIVTGPSKDIPMVVLGVNDSVLSENHREISIASCTTNCLAPLARSVHEKFQIAEALMTTVHASTQSQLLVDGYREDLRDGRSAFQNIVPSSTGAAKAVGMVYPALKGKLTGIALRVPVATVSVVDLTVRFERKTSLEQILNHLLDEENTRLKGILAVSKEEGVSSDFKGNSHSCIVDATSCVQLNESFYKLIAWYDNEWGYSSRVCDVVMHSLEKMDR